MNIYVNSKLQEVSAQATIIEVLGTLEISSFNGLALAVNSSVIPKSVWETHVLQPNDKLVLIRAAQGG